MFISIITFSVHNIIFIIMFSVSLFMFISVRGFDVICVNSRSNLPWHHIANNKNYDCRKCVKTNNNCAPEFTGPYTGN